MDFNAVKTNPDTGSLPSLMYIDYTQPSQPRKRLNKMHVSAACINCKKAHLACDVSRPCNRCVTTDKADSCHDIQHKKRGRPKMLRDANNNKIRPSVSTSAATAVHQKTALSNRILPLSPLDSTAPSNMITILLSMDLCCARVSDESLDYLELYPQEFSHRSLYDFLVPGEDQKLSKLHRCLLDNAVQHVHTKLPSNLIRSSYEPFFSNSLDTLLVIANGSLTLKQKLRFKRGRDREQAMHCSFYLGGGFGVDLFDNALEQLYIVCLMTPSIAADEGASLIRLPPLMMIHHPNDSSSSCSVSPKTVPDQSEEDEDRQATDAPKKSPTTSKHILKQTESNSNNNSLIDKFRHTQQRQQFIHPHEMYYLRTTSSRLSSEAVACTASSYLSNGTSGPLASYNNNLSK